MSEMLIPAAAAAVYILAMLLCIPEHTRRKSRSNGIYLPGFFYWVGAVCGGVFAVLGFCGSGSGTFTVMVFGALAVLCSLLMLGWRNCFIVYDDEGFTQQNLICMRRRFRYEDVTGWYLHPGNPAEATVCALGKKVTFYFLSPNSAGFLTALKKGYRKAHGGKSLPGRPNSKHTSGFRAHVRNPGEFLFIFVLLVVFLVGMGGWCAWMIWEPLDGSDCETLTVTFRSWSLNNNDELHLTAEGYEEAFEIRGYPQFVSRPEALVEHCNDETVFTVQARFVDPDDGPDYYWIQSIRAGGIDYLTLDDATAYNRTNLSVLFWSFGGFLIIWFMMGALMYMVGSNPAKFPKWLVKGLFKEGYIEY